MYTNFEQERDEVLIDRLRDGESSIVDYIMDKYKFLVRSKAQSMYILGADTEDLIQEGMIGLFKAVRDYDCGRDASFFTFAELCISRQMYTAIQAAQRKKHWPLNSYVSLNSEGKEQEEHSGLGELLSTGQGGDPETLFLDKERMEYLEAQIDKELSAFEKQVLDLYMTGMTYSQIARVLGRDEKSTDNALQRVKSKIKKILKS
ncbi:MAG: RNA polymerase sporulation sigma factor SigH [Lachnospiraceae bacterium]|nr:RNA polymerase sporulation sigma factor SigH [Lachnospiraceae bacterium]